MQNERFADDSHLDKQIKWHPYRIMIFVFMVGSGIIFLSLTSVCFFYLTNGVRFPELQFPDWFVLGTFLLLLNAAVFYKSRELFLEKKLKAFRNVLRTSLLLSLAFLACQLLGWQELVDQGMFLQSNVLIPSFTSSVAYICFI